MAEITISELPAKTSLLDSDLIVIDDGTQSYRVTGAQLREFLKVNFLSVGTVVWSQSALATDNPGRLPLWTGEYIASASTIYPDFYTWVKNKHPELCKTKEQYDAALTQFGECPFYVVDEEEGSLRLPKLANYIKMANNADGITQSEAGLPNITGTLGSNVFGAATGAFTYNNTARGDSGGSNAEQGTATFNASLSSEVYGNSETVTPAHTTLFPWVFAYNATVPASTAQAAEFQEGLSGKADANLANTTPSQSFKETAVSWGIPDYTTAVEVSLPYTATYPCYIATGPNDITFEMFINDEKVYYSADIGNGLNSQSAYFWLDTGDVIRATGTPNWVKCFALKGVNND